LRDRNREKGVVMLKAFCVTILVLMLLGFIGWGGFGIITGIIGAIVGIVTGIVGAIVGIVGGVFGVVFGLLATILALAMPLLIIGLIVLGAMKLFACL